MSVPCEGDVVDQDYLIGGKRLVGGMGAVLEAWDRSLERSTAIKVILRENISDADRTRFFGEARALAKLAHPNIVQVYRLGDIDGDPFIAMQWVEGTTLDAFVRQSPQRRLDTHQTLDLLMQAAHGLSAAHAAGVVHRDIKPENLLITPAGGLVIIDFGLAKGGQEIGLRATMPGTIMGTPMFASPEQLEGIEADRRSDIYSLGLVGFFMLAGRPPFQAESFVKMLMMQTEQPLPTLAEAGVAVDPLIDELLQEMCAKDPDERPRTMDAICDKLLHLQQRLGMSMLQTGRFRRISAAADPSADSAVYERRPIVSPDTKPIPAPAPPSDECNRLRTSTPDMLAPIDCMGGEHLDMPKRRDRLSKTHRLRIIFNLLMSIESLDDARVVSIHQEGADEQAEVGNILLVDGQVLWIERGGEHGLQRMLRESGEWPTPIPTNAPDSSSFVNGLARDLIEMTEPLLRQDVVIRQRRVQIKRDASTSPAVAPLHLLLEVTRVLDDFERDVAAELYERWSEKADFAMLMLRPRDLTLAPAPLEMRSDRAMPLSDLLEMSCAARELCKPKALIEAGDDPQLVIRSSDTCMWVGATGERRLVLLRFSGDQKTCAYYAARISGDLISLTAAAETSSA